MVRLVSNSRGWNQRFSITTWRLFLFLLSWHGVVGHVIDYSKRKRGQARNKQQSLEFPTAWPSYDYLARGRQVSIQSVDWCADGNMLPLQRYSCSSPPHSTQQPSPQTPCISIQSVLNDPTKFNLSKSSEYMLGHYHSLSSQQQADLIHKIQVENRASQPVEAKDALQILYCDEHICVVNKPSGVLSVPGARRNPSMANLVYETMRPTDVKLDQMVVHRLDMATSGIIVYALSLQALTNLHLDFKHRRVQKTYQALLHINDNDDNQSSLFLQGNAMEGEIHVAMERDPENPPFMRVAKPRTKDAMKEDEPDNTILPGPSHKLYKQVPQESLTAWRLLSTELRDDGVDEPTRVARLELRPQTGRTHQLRVHCAYALNAPIVGDDIYGRRKSDISQSSLCLHAQKLCIHHPISGAPMIFEADPPF